MLIPTKKYILSETPQRGLIRIVDIQNDKTLLVPSLDIAKDIVHIRFELDLEQYPCKELQEAYTAIGLELFSIEPYVIASPNDDLSALLAQEQARLVARGVTLYRS